MLLRDPLHYLVHSTVADESRYEVVFSYLPKYLIQRLITYAIDTVLEGSGLMVVGVVDAAVGTPRWAPKHIGDFVAPKFFTEDELGLVWSLLSGYDEAYALWTDWRQDPRYNSRSEDNKPNYFKNAVDHFCNKMEKRWSQQLK